MEFSIYAKGGRVKFIESKLKEFGYEIIWKTYLIYDEYAIKIQVTDIEEAKTLCDKLGIDSKDIKLSVSEID